MLDVFNFIITALWDIVSTLRLTRPLEFAAVIVVVFLFTSPGAVFSMVGAGVKLGALDFAKEQKEKNKEAEAE